MNDSIYYSYLICAAPKAYVNGKVSLTHPYDGSCQKVLFSSPGSTIEGNPRIQFDESIILGQQQQFPFLMVPLPQHSVRSMDQDYFALREQENGIPTGFLPPQRLLLTQALTNNELCTQIEYQVAGSIPIVFGQYHDPNDSTRHYYYVHDPRYVLQDNTVDNPLPDGGGTLVQQTIRHGTIDNQVLCSNVPRSFQNEANCYLSHHPNVCDSISSPSSLSPLQPGVKINLNKQTLNLFYSLTKDEQQPRYVYAVQILNRMQDDKVPSPCQAATRSRWIQVPGIVSKNECETTTTNVQDMTKDVLAQLLINEYDAAVMENNEILDIYFPSRNSLCHENDMNTKGYQIFANDICWQHVHPDHLQIYDMTTSSTIPWSTTNEDISIPAKQGLEQLTLPTNVPLQSWNEIKSQFPTIGKLNQMMEFKYLNSNLTTIPTIRSYFLGPNDDNNNNNNNNNHGFVVCGSLGEVGNDLDLNGEENRGAFVMETPQNFTGSIQASREIIWTTIALQAQDQLRQRIAWSLSQILVRVLQIYMYQNIYMQCVLHVCVCVSVCVCLCVLAMYVCVCHDVFVVCVPMMCVR